MFFFFSRSTSSGRNLLLKNHSKKDLKTAVANDLKTEDEYRFGRLSNIDGFNSIESMIRIKEAEAIMFRSKVDEARREAENYMRMIRAKSERVEEEYTEKLSKLH
ncbi:hypothetical protein GQ457_17G014760 [Hibiscus cannabinus]